MLTITKKDKKRDRGVAVGANLGLIATVIAAVRGYFADKKRQRELARKKRERKAKRIRFAVSAVKTAAYFVPTVIALAKAAGFIAKKREKKQEEEAENIDIEIIQAEPVSSEEEVYKMAMEDTPEA